MPRTKMQELTDLGQSIWIDNISRSMIESGKLAAMIENGLRGQTSNPTIFKQAIGGSGDYDAAIVKLNEQGKSAFEIYDELTVRDVQEACDQFNALYTQTDRLDGYVSLEINPHLANEYEAQAKEGLRLWNKVNRKNLMVKVPATQNGCKVVEDLIAQGVNVNVTLIFSIAQYVAVAQSYLRGLKRLSAKTKDLSQVRSVASFFVSRIDTSVDKLIDEKGGQASGLKGKIAIANCELAFAEYQRIFSSAEWQALEALKAAPQRVLWASTGTKNPAYSDVLYIEELIANPTVNTVPDKTLDAFLAHGRVKIALPRDPAPAAAKIKELTAAGISIDAVCEKLLKEGLDAFDQSFDELIGTIESKSKKLAATK